MTTDVPPPRSRAQRRADALERLRTDVDLWVASADETGNVYLVPLSFVWDGTALTIATPLGSAFLDEQERIRRHIRIFVNGELPDRDPGRLELRVDSLRVAPWLTLLQSNLPVDGIATFAMVDGSAWLVENQGDHFWGGDGKETKPFRLVEIPLAR